MIRVEHVFKHFEDFAVLNDINLNVEKGEFFGIIGPNGSGKSTLLQAISGVEQVSSGSIYLDRKPLAAYSRKALAKWVAMLQQDALPPVRFTVREVIEMGRYPFQNWFGEELHDQSELIDSIMERLGVRKFANRMLDQLSGGERQRVALGKVMAQQPTLLMLDEPTTFLDIGYQIQMMDYVRNWQQDSKLTVVAVLHDLNLAAQYCDRILVLHEGKVVKVGAPSKIINKDLIFEVYGTEPVVIDHPISNRPQILLHRS